MGVFPSTTQPTPDSGPNAFSWRHTCVHKLPHGLLVFGVRHRPVVPLDLALHVGDTFAEDSVCDHHVGWASGYIETAHQRLQRRHVVAIGLVNVPPEYAPALGQRLERQDLVSVTQRLLPV